MAAGFGIVAILLYLGWEASHPIHPCLSSFCYLELFFSYTMAIKVLVPTALQKFTKDQATIECGGSNIKELLDSLEANCPGIQARLCDEQGNPRRFLNLYVNSEDIRFLDGVNTSLSDGDEVSIVPAVAGG